MENKKSNLNFAYGLIAGIILYKVIFDLLLPMIIG